MKTTLILTFILIMVAGNAYAELEPDLSGGVHYNSFFQQQPDQTPDPQMPYSPALNPGIDANGYARE